MHHALSVRTLHCCIDLCDSCASDTQNCRCQIHRDAETDESPSVRRRNLKQRYVDWQPSARQQTRHLLQRDGYVVELATSGQTAHFATYEKDPMAIMSARSTSHLRQR